jgi:Coenzyme PQQ synthesis protein D (PqqD)
MSVLLQPTTKPEAATDVIQQSTANATVLLHLKSGKYYALDDIGIDIWNLCDGNKTLAEIISQIATDYDAPVDTIEKDVSDLLEDLAREQLIVIS